MRPGVPTSRLGQTRKWRGEVDAICDLPTTTSSMIRSGDLCTYRLTAPQRMASLLDVPTATEHGVPSLSIGMWFGVYAPVGTPKPVIATLNKAFCEIVQDKTVAEKLAGIETYLLPIDPGDARGRPRQARLADRPVAADHREGRRPGGVALGVREEAVASRSRCRCCNVDARRAY